MNAAGLELSGSRIGEALTALGRPPGTSSTAPFLSDLSVNELILVEQVGYLPVDLVSGVGSASWYPLVNAPGAELTQWTTAIFTAVDQARRGVVSELAARMADGVVAMRLEFEREPANVLTCTMLGTALRRIPHSRRPGSGRPGKRRAATEPFTTTLSARDFHLLVRGGYQPSGIVVGVSVVGFPRRSVAQGLGVARENVELTEQTNALYAAREQAMQRIEAEATGLGADGIVAVELRERPVRMTMTHAVELLAVGTAVRSGSDGHVPLDPHLQLTYDDPIVGVPADT
jgi:uncharacterized protein YbjQ (UPF0145 family)